MLWELVEMEIGREYFTERESKIVRISEHSVLIGNKITIPGKFRNREDYAEERTNTGCISARYRVKLHLFRGIAAGDCKSMFGASFAKDSVQWR